jgi:hypothetical protein
MDLIVYLPTLPPPPPPTPRLFIFDAVVGLRASLISMVPKAIMLATAGGIGLFLAFIG